MTSNWQLKTLGEICTKIGSGATPHGGKTSYQTEGVSLIRSMNVYDREFTEKNLAFLNDQQAEELSNVTLEESDVLLNITGASIARCCIVPKQYLPGRVNQHVSIIRPQHKIILPEFLAYLLTSKLYKDKLLNIGEKGGSTRQAITKAQIQDFSVTFPSIAEQKHIVAVLDEAFDAIAKAKENAEKNLANARELFDSYLQNVFAAPVAGWEEKTLGEVYDVRDGTHDSPKYHNVGFPLVTSKNLKNDSLTFENIQYISEEDYLQINRRSKVDKRDVLFAMIGTIGSPVVIEMEPNFAIKNVALFKVPENQNSYFLKYFLDSKAVIAKMASDAKGTTQKFVGLGYLRNFKIYIPLLAEQNSVVAKLSAISVETQKLQTIYQNKLAAIEELKKSILQKAFSGKLAGARS